MYIKVSFDWCDHLPDSSFNVRRDNSPKVFLRVMQFETNEAQPSLNQLRGVWKSDETLFKVFDIGSKTILLNNSWRNSKQKFTNFYDN